MLGYRHFLQLHAITKQLSKRITITRLNCGVHTLVAADPRFLIHRHELRLLEDERQRRFETAQDYNEFVAFCPIQVSDDLYRHIVSGEMRYQVGLTEDNGRSQPASYWYIRGEECEEDAQSAMPIGRHISISGLTCLVEQHTVLDALASASELLPPVDPNELSQEEEGQTRDDEEWDTFRDAFMEAEEAGTSLLPIYPQFLFVGRVKRGHDASNQHFLSPTKYEHVRLFAWGLEQEPLDSHKIVSLKHECNESASRQFSISQEKSDQKWHRPRLTHPVEKGLLLCHGVDNQPQQ